MKFLSGARNRSITYVVRPERLITDVARGVSSKTPALRAKFKEHQFDSDTDEMKEMYRFYAQFFNDTTVNKKEHIKPEEVKEMVEQHLIKHPDFGRADGRGIFLDNSATLSEQTLRAKGAQRRCIFMQDIGDQTIQCSEFVDDPESDFCPQHEALVVSAVQSASAQHTAQELVAPTTGD